MVNSLAASFAGRDSGREYYMKKHQFGPTYEHSSLFAKVDLQRANEIFLERFLDFLAYMSQASNQGEILSNLWIIKLAHHAAFAGIQPAWPVMSWIKSHPPAYLARQRFGFLLQILHDYTLHLKGKVTRE